MMKKYLLHILILILSGCSSYNMSPFAQSSGWVLDGNVASSHLYDMNIDFGGNGAALLTNAGDGGYELNFIHTDEQFEAYDSFCKNYFTSVMRQVPLSVDSIQFIMADRFMVFTPRVLNKWMPDYIRKGDGTEIVVQANPLKSLVQPHDEIWRNVLIDRKLKRNIVVDRMVKNGKHLAVAYVLQSENHRVPFTSTYHYDVTDWRNTQPVGEVMMGLLDATVKAYESHSSTLEYADLIHSADSCFFSGDYVGASRYYDMAFGLGGDIPGFHLYNAACAASLAGDADLAFRRLNVRLTKEPDWYLDEPDADADLSLLHDDGRWESFVQVMKNRRDRIEAGFDKPLRALLRDIARSDQEIRHEFLSAYRTEPRNQSQIDSLIAVMQHVDSVNQEKICAILDSVGFVGSDKVGDACSVFWLVIQHAPLSLQKKYFPLFSEAASHGELSLENLAMMDDRIAMFEGRPQKYGTQIDGGKLYPLLDAERVDQWRHDMGLPPLAEYLRNMGVAQ